ncbi:septum-promoting GTP-binding protein 1 [Juglans microcarpa x Juglans regia]|uniref:septum-promoting GTP-binding protein 1 n=1 Tax=Juglans microcarpa x Juglans regia TaxID=2249226 RepID=UPI001B7DEC72|nr:septum-promoting GTP-binding protein 1 [Juglans microcarpa x Juglans regia]
MRGREALESFTYAFPFFSHGQNRRKRSDSPPHLLIKMSQLCRKVVQLGLRRRLRRRMLILRGWFRRHCDRLLMCSLGKRIRYRMLPRAPAVTSPSLGDTPVVVDFTPAEHVTPACHNHDVDTSDLVALKISLLGDSQSGKTSFLAKYAGKEEEQAALEKKELNLMDKTLLVGGARISYCIWEVGGGKKSRVHIPAACKDSVAILFMFDLTSRCTLNGVVRWHQEARKWNQTAIPVLVGTKFDEFIQLPIDLQWTIASEARALAKALNATLFFSSATYNINVNKIFKFVTAKLFDLPWTVERNLTMGEPIIDF